jgi:hypothetical protein
MMMLMQEQASPLPPGGHASEAIIAKQKKEATIQQRVVHDRQMGDLMRQCPVQSIEPNANDITSTASLYVFATALERTSHCAMWERVKRLASPEEARERAREAILTHVATRPGAELLQLVVQFGRDALRPPSFVTVGGAAAPPRGGGERVVIRITDDFMPPPPVLSSSDDAGGGGGSSADSSPGSGSLRGVSALLQSLPMSLPCIRPLVVVSEGGGAMLPPMSLGAFDAEKLVVEHDCYFNYLRYALAIIQGHPFFRYFCQ